MVSDEPVHNMPVMAKCCASCPFKENERGVWSNMELANTVIQRNLLKSQQICHHPRIKGKEETHRCRGYYDYAFTIYQRLGLDPEKHFLNKPDYENLSSKKG